AAVIDRLPSRIEARRQCRVGDNAPAPNAVYQIVLADDPATIAHQIDKKIEHLRFERDGLGPAAQFAPLDIEHVIAKSENHPRSPRLGPSGLFLREKQALRKRQSHLKGESGASQSLSFGIRAFLHRRDPVLRWGGERMPVTALRQAPIAGLAVPIGTLALVGIAIAASEVGDNALALLHNGFAFLSILGVVAGFSPAVAGIVAFVLFLAGVVSGLSGFAFSAVAACMLLPPLQAVPLLMLLSICNQLLSV